MRRTIFNLLLFGLVNIVLVPVHIKVFQSSFPFAAWATIMAHAAGLVFFPYQKLFSK